MSRSYRSAYRAVARGGIAALATFLIAFSSVQKTKAQPDTAPHQQAIPQKKSTNSAPLVLPPQVVTQQIKRDNTQGAQETAPVKNPNSPGLTDIIQAVSAFMSMLATVALAIFAVVQIIIYRKQTKVMTLKASARSIRMSQRSAKAAEDAVTKSDAILTHAQETAERQLRAYMRVELIRETSIVLGEGTRVGEDFKVKTTIGIANSGQTPAYDVVVHSNIHAINFPLVGELPVLVIEPGGSKTSVHPNQPTIGVEIFSDKKITQQQATSAQIRGPNNHPAVIRFYMYGIVQYRDIFGKPQETPFRCVSDGLALVGARFHWCEEGNNPT